MATGQTYHEGNLPKIGGKRVTIRPRHHRMRLKQVARTEARNFLTKKTKARQQGCEGGHKQLQQQNNRPGQVTQITAIDWGPPCVDGTVGLLQTSLPEQPEQATNTSSSWDRDRCRSDTHPAEATTHLNL